MKISAFLKVISGFISIGTRVHIVYRSIIPVYFILSMYIFPAINNKARCFIINMDMDCIIHKLKQFLFIKFQPPICRRLSMPFGGALLFIILHTV